MDTPAVQDYLKAIYELQGEDAAVGTTVLADRLGVTPASASVMVKRLAAAGLATHEPYRGVALTGAGARGALEVIRHHRLIESFLADVLGVPWDQVHGEAERLEHVLSEELEERIDVALGFPATDPHGSPIPTHDGRVDRPETVALSALEPGVRAVVAEVRDDDPSLLRYLGELGLYPGTDVTVVGTAPFGGPVTVRIGEAEHGLGREAIDGVLVTLPARKELR